MCNGKTEEYYLKFLKSKLPKRFRQTTDVKINQSKRPDLESLIKEAKRKKAKSEKERNPIDEIWLVFDHDYDSKVSTVFEKAWQNHFKIAHSCICLEHWFLLHFENTGSKFSKCDEAEKKLKQFYPQYEKPGFPAFFEQIYRYQHKAISRAKTIEKNAPHDILLSQRNPCFTIYRLVEQFDKFINKQ